MYNEHKKQDFHELTSIRDFIRFAVTQFTQTNLYFGHGTDNALDEAFALVFDCLRLPHESHELFLDSQLTHHEKNQLQHLIDKRIRERKPVPYLTNTAWFAGLSFYVDERVIIPRSPIGELIEKQFSPWIAPDEVHHILDMCTGSGCIAIACAYFFPEAFVDAIDISPEALHVAKRNVEEHALTQQVTLYESDLFEKLPPKHYDIIVVNPPYVDEQDMNALPSEYRHEPTLSLAAGPDGLAIVNRILKRANDYLSPNGILIVEVGNSQEAMELKYPQVPFTWLDFERGGKGVFLLTAKEINAHKDKFGF